MLIFNSTHIELFEKLLIGNLKEYFVLLKKCLIIFTVQIFEPTSS